MNDQQLRVLVTLADKRNFTRTAEALHMTQPAVTQQIHALERSLGATLFDRSNKAVYLTKAGEVVSHYARDILNMYTRMQRIVDDLTQSAHGTLAIGSSYTYGEYVLPHVISRFRSLYPEITPTVTIANTSDIADQVANHRLDVGIVEGDLNDSTLRIEAFADDTMVVIAPAQSQRFTTPTVTIETLRNKTWILREPGSGTRAVQDRVFAELGFPPRVIMEFGSTQLIKEAVEAGLGWSILSQTTLRKERALQTLLALDIEGLPIHRKFSCVTIDSPFQTKAMALFVEFVKAAGAEV